MILLHSLELSCTACLECPSLGSKVVLGSGSDPRLVVVQCRVGTGTAHKAAVGGAKVNFQVVIQDPLPPPT